MTQVVQQSGSKYTVYSIYSSWHQFPFSMSKFPAMIPKILNVIRDHFIQPSNRPVIIKVWAPPGGPRRYCRWAAVITEIELEIN